MKLISFTIENYRSFGQKQILNLNFDSSCVNAIIGPNGCGKTNIFMALNNFITLVRRSTQFRAKNIIEPFLLLVNNEKKPTAFTLKLEDMDVVYTYSFSILNDEIKSEYLKRKIGNSLETIFSRKSIINGRYSKFGFNSKLLKSTRADSLILTRAYEENNNIAVAFFGALFKIRTMSGNLPIDMTADAITKDQKFKEEALKFLNEADLSIKDISIDKVKIPRELIANSPFSEEIKNQLSTQDGYKVSTMHYVRDVDSNIVDIREFSIGTNESTGTQRMFELIYPLIDTLENGYTLYIDEFDTSLHPAECEFIVKMFKNNKNGAHLIVNTHYTEIMDLIGRKNICLLGKNRNEETIIGKIPSDARESALGKKYKQGVFGAVPNILSKEIA